LRQTAVEAIFSSANLVWIWPALTGFLMRVSAWNSKLKRTASVALAPVGWSYWTMTTLFDVCDQIVTPAHNTVSETLL